MAQVNTGSGEGSIIYFSGQLAKWAGQEEGWAVCHPLWRWDMLSATVTDFYLGWPQGCYRGAETPDDYSASGGGSDVGTFRETELQLLCFRDR